MHTEIYVRNLQTRSSDDEGTKMTSGYPELTDELH